ncbi:hypothetical protein GA0070216_10144 [Micromonospora matsumotoense]|uniref:PKD domain-containing protein n=1 Tax=Micromonospora matsumotoense TaxID=121616 RepID=A0A1C4TWR5_9ACTN|nr:hypothetical protein [Micromonospora matsumotoense]SCE63885.1 hypothetical protein GA0070216_10144 [Micromonospora matsumotoense]
MQALAPRLLATIAAALAMMVAVAAPAQADQWGGVDCQATPADSRCTVTVTYTGAGGGSTGGGGGNVVCKIGAEVVECQNGFGWLGSDSCYYGKDAGGFLPANQWIKSCIDPATGDMTGWGVVTLFQPPAALGVITQQAMDNLAIPRPVIAASPALTTQQFVHVPVWWWVQPGWWQTQTASASAGGLTITARAVPRKITWYAGDGRNTVCTGPGTRWTASTSPTAPSPTCGHTYSTTSADSPGGKFTVRAVATWDVSWSGGGFSGTEPNITTTTSANVTVTELRAVITS